MSQIVEGHNITVPQKSGWAREALFRDFQKKEGGDQGGERSQFCGFLPRSGSLVGSANIYSRPAGPIPSPGAPKSCVLRSGRPRPRQMLFHNRASGVS